MGRIAFRLYVILDVTLKSCHDSSFF